MVIFCWNYMKFAIKVYYGNFPNFNFNLKYLGLNKMISLTHIAHVCMSGILFSVFYWRINLLCRLQVFILIILFMLFPRVNKIQCCSNLCLIIFNYFYFNRLLCSIVLLYLLWVLCKYYVHTNLVWVYEWSTCRSNLCLTNFIYFYLLIYFKMC